MTRAIRRISAWENNHRLQSACLLFVIYGILLFSVYAQYYFQDMLPMSGDGVTFAMDQVFVKKMIEETGEFPLWNKWLAAGIPFTKISPTLLLSFLPIKEMIYTIYIVPIAMGAVFSYLFFREIRCSAWASLSMSLIYLFSIHLGGVRKSHGFIILSVAVFPVILYFVERYFTTRKLRWLIGSSVAMAVQFHLGALQLTVYADIFLVVYLISFGFHYKIKILTMLKHGMAWGMTYLGLIAIRLSPMLEQNLTYASAGSAGTSYDTFVSFSIHPIKLIQMIFPEFFGRDIYSALGSQYSSGIDIDIFLGYMVFLLIIWGAAFCIRDFRARFYLVSMCVAFLYSALGALPAIAHVLYQIPYLGDFRCPSRALYLFIFMAYTLAAIGLTTLKNWEAVKKFLRLSVRISGAILAVVVVAVVTAAMYAGISGGFSDASFEPIAKYVQTYLNESIVWILVSILGITLAMNLMRKYPRWGHSGICLIVGIATVAQTFPFTSVTQPSRVLDLNAVDEVSARLASEIGNWKVWDAFAGIDGGHESLVSLNRGMSKGIASINAFVAFNNPNLYRLFTQEEDAPMNYSGLLTGSLKASQNLKLQNSLLSMLGVRYLIDSSKIIESDSTFSRMNQAREVHYSSDSIVVPNSQGELSVQYEYFQPEPNVIYEISFSCDVTQEQKLYVDFYAGENYDGAAQQANFVISEGTTDYDAIIYAGNSDEFENIMWRVVSWGTEEFAMRDFQITKIASVAGEYIPWNPELDPSIYVNENARDILYIPDAIEQIEDTEILYRDTIYYALDRVNYMESWEDCTLHPENAVISNIDFGCNQITAKIETEEPTFVNFSQCHYPGWKAYVDGKETDLYMVNGVIMGMEVPKGTHEISFSFEPLSYAIGAAISGGTVIILLIGLGVTKRKSGLIGLSGRMSIRMKIRNRKFIVLDGTVKKLIGGALFVLILVHILFMVGRFLEPKSGGMWCQNMYALDDNSVDVMFFGSSNIYSNINPAILYEKEGIASYIMAGSSQPIWNSYYYMREAYKTQHPKLVVIDMKSLHLSSDYTNLSDAYMQVKGLRPSINKWEAIKSSSERDALSLLFGYPVYHTRWRENEALFGEKPDNKYGAMEMGYFPVYVNYQSFPLDYHPDVSENVIAMTEKNETYLRKMIELAQNEGSSVLLLKTPYILDEYADGVYNHAEQIADEYQVACLNMNKIDFGFLYGIEMADIVHLNSYGVEKVSNYLCEYLKENYDLPDRRGGGQRLGQLFEDISGHRIQMSPYSGERGSPQQQGYTAYGTYSGYPNANTISHPVRGGNMVQGQYRYGIESTRPILCRFLQWSL